MIHPHILLASKSPRRQELIKGLLLPYSVVPLDVDETFPAHLKEGAVAEYLAEKKSSGYDLPLADNEVLLTCDTIVWINGKVMNKPESRDEALAMLTELSGAMHQVFTGVCLRTAHKSVVFSDETKVWFHPIAKETLALYVDRFQPYDKAGAYGIQEYIGYVGIRRIEGCFYNVMGMPTSRVYLEVQRIFQS